MPRTHLVTYGNRVFLAASAANSWNSILVAIRLCNTVTSFITCIKTYLFNLAYPINQWLKISCTDRFYLSNVMVVVMCVLSKCVLFIVQRFWVLHKKHHINLTLHYIIIMTRSSNVPSRNLVPWPLSLKAFTLLMEQYNTLTGNNLGPCKGLE